MPGPLVKPQLLMCGRDEALLAIRASVLDTIGCETSLAYTFDAARAHLAEKPRLILICHTCEERLAAQLRGQALQAGIPTYHIEKLLPPEQLLNDVSSLLQEQTVVRSATSKRSS